jgi:hypothetical protein
MLNSPVAFEILSYLKDRPQGQDTKARIVDVTLTTTEAELVQLALAELVERHLLEQLSGPDGRIHHRLAASARQRLLDLMKPESRTERSNSERG